MWTPRQSPRPTMADSVRKQDGRAHARRRRKDDFPPPSPMAAGVLAFDSGKSTAQLSVGVLSARNLIPKDVSGTSDPYCVVRVGNRSRQTSIQYECLNPDWREIVTFEVVPPTFDNNDRREDYYVNIEVWDYDKLNQDDFLGATMLPLTFLTEQPTTCWMPLGRHNAKDKVRGEVLLSLSLKSSKVLHRHPAESELYEECVAKGFHYSVIAGDHTLQLPGLLERVEMMLDDLLVEVSGWRAIGRCYLTDYRLVIICQKESHHLIDNATDLSMWVALNDIISIDQVENDQVIRHSGARTRKSTFSGGIPVKTLAIHCSDFRLIRLTFMQLTAKEDSGRTQWYDSSTHREGKETLSGNLAASSAETSNDLDSITGSSSRHHPQAKVADGNSKAQSGEILAQTPNHTKSLGPEEEMFRTLRQSVISPGASIIFASPLGTDRAFYVNDDDSGTSLSVSDGMSSLQTPLRPMKEADARGPLWSVEQLASMVYSLLWGQVTPEIRSIGAPLPPLVSLQQRLEFLMCNAADCPPSRLFVSCSPSVLVLNSCHSFDMDREMTRLQVPSSHWRRCDLNITYGLCSTYPTVLYVPAKSEDEHIQRCADFRSKNRLPVLCWYNSKHSNGILRCAQPKTGAMGKYSIDDESVIGEARLCCSVGSLVIFDARSRVAANSNMLRGKGTEDTSRRYHNCKLLFLDIANIHAMRDSVDRLRAVCEHPSQANWLSQLESTQWLTHCSSVLRGAASIARHIDERGVMALIHCSDGWDRTSQLSALSQLLLDQYYRTFDGFKVLVEKEWLHFGHKFQDRLGYPQHPQERSPVFLQFLDCTWQVLTQFPSAFEFNSRFLLTVAIFLNTGWFGTFLFNSSRERIEKQNAHCTVSLWAHLDAIRPTLLNNAFVPCNEMLKPQTSLRRLQLWHEYFLRFDEVALEPQSTDELDVQPETGTSSRGPQSAQVVVWVPDERVSNCHDCHQHFTALRRKHHCRACGHVFCGECTRQRLSLPKFGYFRPERVCDMCYRTHSGFEDIHEEYDVVEMQPDLSITTHFRRM